MTTGTVATRVADADTTVGDADIKTDIVEAAAAEVVAISAVAEAVVGATVPTRANCLSITAIILLQVVTFVPSSSTRIKSD